MQGHFLDEMEVATTAIDEATILQIKTTVALPFQSSLTMLVVWMVAKKSAKKCTARSEFFFTNFLVFVVVMVRWAR